MILASNLELALASCRAGIIGAFPVGNARAPESLESWLEAKLQPIGLSLAQLREGPVLAPGSEPVAFADRRFSTPSGKVVTQLPYSGGRYWLQTRLFPLWRYRLRRTRHPPAGDPRSPGGAGAAPARPTRPSA